MITTNRLPSNVRVHFTRPAPAEERAWRTSPAGMYRISARVHGVLDQALETNTLTGVAPHLRPLHFCNLSHPLSTVSFLGLDATRVMVFRLGIAHDETAAATQMEELQTLLEQRFGEQVDISIKPVGEWLYLRDLVITRK